MECEPLAESVDILLVAVPRLLGDILRTRTGNDVRIVGDVPRDDALLQRARESDANVIVLATAEPSKLAVDRWLLGPAALRGVVAITPDGRRATLHLVRVHRRSLDTLPPEHVVGALRDALLGAATGHGRAPGS